MRNLWFVFTFLFAISCGRYTEDESVESTLLKTNSQISLDCEVNSVSLNKITEENIDSELDCLKDSVAVYSLGVRTKKKGHISKRQLKLVIKNFFKDKSETIAKGVDLLFKAEFLFFGGDDEYIKVDNVYEIIEWFRLFNNIYLNPGFQEAISEIPLNETVSYRTHQLYRRRIQQAATRILGGVKKMRDSGAARGIREVSIPYLLDTFTRLAELYPSDTDENRESQLVKLRALDQIKKYTFLKKLFFGGSAGTLSGENIDRLIEIAPDILAAIYDIVRIQKIDFGKASWKKYQMINSDLTILEHSFYGGNAPETILITFDQAVDALSKLELVKEIDLKKYSNEVEFIFRELFKVKGNGLKYVDLLHLMGHGHVVVTQMKTVHQIYEEHKEILQLNRSLNEKELAAIGNFTTQGEIERKTVRQLIRVLREARFFPSIKEMMPPVKKPTAEKTEVVPMSRYDLKYYRSATGLTAMLSYEYIMRLIFESFGVFDKKVLMKYKMDPESLMNMTLNFRNFLVDQGMWRDDPLKGAQNVILMANLFQFQSNGRDDLNVNEAAEYMGLVFTTSELGSRIVHSLRKQVVNDKGEKEWTGTGVCPEFAQSGEPIIQKDSGAIHFEECLKPNFYKLVFSFTESLPELKKYLQREESLGQKHRYIKAVAEFSRDDPEGVYASKRDVLLMVGGTLNLEVTLMRFDSHYISTNSCVVPEHREDAGKGNYCMYNPSAGNGVLDAEELTWAFKVYKKAIFSIVNDLTSKKKVFSPDKKGDLELIRAAFFYLVKNQKLPRTKAGQLKVVLYRYFGKKKKVKAERIDIAMLLKFVASSTRN